MINAQGSKCGICNKDLSLTRETHVDHCHATNKLRGILCHTCNTKLGWYEKNSDNIIAYLLRPDVRELKEQTNV